jgi:hypothetical protein
MDPSQTLRLRCTDRLVPTGAPDLAPFLRGARTVDPERDEVLTWIAPRHVVPGTCGLRARERAARIPVSTPRLDLAAFAVGVRTHLPAPSPRALALAAALPLALSRRTPRPPTPPRTRAPSRPRRRRPRTTCPMEASACGRRSGAPASRS